ncbi:hypothetical protein V8C35DRAFT_64267 [Trichoderma chlorosporum]
MANPGQNRFAIMTGSPAAPSWRGGRVSTACNACHRVKMKCVRIGNSACIRCQRTMRECYARQPLYSDKFEVVIKTPENFNIQSKSRASNRTRRQRGKGRPHTKKATPAECNRHATALGHNKNLVTGLPSICLTAPLLAVLGGYVVKNSLHINPSSPHSPEAFITPPGSVFSDVPDRCMIDSPLSKVEMRQLLKMFCSRLLPSIPVFAKDDFENLEVLAQQQPELLYSICYVTARYLPGGLSTVRMVYPYILRFVQDISAGVSLLETANVTSFRALMVLYAFSEVALPNIESPHCPYMLPTQLLKTATEMYGNQLGLHRSIEGARAMLSLPPSQWLASASYKRYTYWLWLFTMSHHSAIITRTPPSIRSDSSIRFASELFAGTKIKPPLRRLLGEVELCLLWEKANAADSNFGEWWCPSERATTACPSPCTVIEIVTRDLAAWRAKYASFIQHGGFGIGLDFHHRFSQFCLSTYAICHYTQLSDSGGREMLVRITLDHAVDMLSWIQELSPVIRESLRYISDFAYVMLVFACVFIVQVCESRHMLPSERRKPLKTVSTTAQLLIDLGLHNFHFPSLYGKLLQRQLVDDQLDSNVGVETDVHIESIWAEASSSNWTDHQPKINGDFFCREVSGDEDLFHDLLNMSNFDWFGAPE